MKVLCCLEQKQGELVIRDHLVTEVWNDYGGGNEGLNQAISFLRKILDDQDKKLVLTIPKKGYVLSGIIKYPALDKLRQSRFTIGKHLKNVAQIAAVLYIIATTVYFIYPVSSTGDGTVQQDKPTTAMLWPQMSGTLKKPEQVEPPFRQTDTRLHAKAPAIRSYARSSTYKNPIEPLHSYLKSSALALPQPRPDPQPMEIDNITNVKIKNNVQIRLDLHF
ncbi:MAG: winged helix-turn-helix domain-containing protein [Williamsia sp.]|nr:winged helix-turn-helix domain-containing protein [Williamsia sp.]